ncbi:DUF3017 domain-containing protein [Streptomyces sp. NPDC088729]|uniref:DUF3017 domain-containing protein n=1 Tax=Streptomyces sp. NPDC088729 TaxID=3365876 RepID=UPI003816D9D5
MGAGTSPADPAPAGAGEGAAAKDVERVRGVVGGGSAVSGVKGVRDPGRSVSSAVVGRAAEAGSTVGEPTDDEQADGAGDGSRDGSADRAGDGSRGGSADGTGDGTSDGVAGGPARRSRRFPSLTRDTARPEGGGRAAPGDAPAPARQWPLLTVLCTAGVGLLVVAFDPFEAAFRVGAILIGLALITGAVLRWAVPSVGMLAVRSRFTDLVTYGLMGTLIVLLALVAQPHPWLDIPVLEDAVHFTIR